MWGGKNANKIPVAPSFLLGLRESQWASASPKQKEKKKSLSKKGVICYFCIL